VLDGDLIPQGEVGYFWENEAGRCKVMGHFQLVVMCAKVVHYHLFVRYMRDIRSVITDNGVGRCVAGEICWLMLMTL